VHKTKHSLYCLLLVVLFRSAIVFAQTYQNFPAPAALLLMLENLHRVNWNTGKVLFQAGLETDRVTFAGNPATAAWEKIIPQNLLASLDPILFTDPPRDAPLSPAFAGAVGKSFSFSDH